MSIVGPRPEVRRYVEQYSDEARRKILSVRPGITDNASIRFRNENKILAAASDIERVYVDEILPEKNSMNIEYVENWSLLDDFKIILCTVWVVLVR
jgi:lipopolysaccharide/colanic/teichoic acid biosynthesis glycosyltransferase